MVTARSPNPVKKFHFLEDLIPASLPIKGTYAEDWGEFYEVPRTIITDFLVRRLDLDPDNYTGSRELESLFSYVAMGNYAVDLKKGYRRNPEIISTPVYLTFMREDAYEFFASQDFNPDRKFNEPAFVNEVTEQGLRFLKWLPEGREESKEKWEGSGKLANMDQDHVDRMVWSECFNPEFAMSSLYDDEKSQDFLWTFKGPEGARGYENEMKRYLKWLAFSYVDEGAYKNPDIVKEVQFLIKEYVRFQQAIRNMTVFGRTFDRFPGGHQSKYCTSLMPFLEFVLDTAKKESKKDPDWVLGSS